MYSLLNPSAGIIYRYQKFQKGENKSSPPGRRCVILRIFFLIMRNGLFNIIRNGRNISMIIQMYYICGRFRVRSFLLPHLIYYRIESSFIISVNVSMSIIIPLSIISFTISVALLIEILIIVIPPYLIIRKLRKNIYPFRYLSGQKLV